MNCKSVIKNNKKIKKAVCEKCEEHEKEVYIKTITDMKAKEYEYRNLWSEC